jgi:hypothetical protein
MIIRGQNGIIDIVVMFSLQDDFYGRDEEDIELTSKDIRGNGLNMKCKTLANINTTSEYEITPVKNVYIDSSIWSRLNIENIELFLINFKRIFIFETREFEVIKKHNDENDDANDDDDNDDDYYDDDDYFYVFPKGDQTRKIKLKYDTNHKNIINIDEFEYEENDKEGEKD